MDSDIMIPFLFFRCSVRCISFLAGWAVDDDGGTGLFSLSTLEKYPGCVLTVN